MLFTIGCYFLRLSLEYSLRGAHIFFLRRVLGLFLRVTSCSITFLAEKPPPCHSLSSTRSFL